MIYDLLDTFKEIGDVDKLAIDSYAPKPGLYIKFSMGEEEPQILVIDKNTQQNGELYNWFKEADYNSVLIEMNKCLDTKKKIHSNNIYTVFMKKDTLTSDSQTYENFKANIDRYYDAFKISKSTKKRNKDKAKSGHKKVHVENQDKKDNLCLPEMDEEIIQNNKEIFLDKYDWLVNTVASYGFESNIYIKLFLDVELKEYKKESMRYLIPRIFNCNDYNIEIDSENFGLSNINMGLNAKKPYLEHKTTNYNVPFRISIDDALDSKKLIEWIESQNDEEGKPILSGYIPVMESETYLFSNKITDEMNSHYLHIEKGIKTIIDSYDFLPGITDKIKLFRLNNYLRLPDFNTENINSRKRLEAIVDELLYNNNLIKNYYVDKPKIKPNFTARHVDLLNVSKDAMHNYFRKCDASSLRSCIDKISRELIKQFLLISTYRILEKSNIAKAMNLRLSLLEYFQIGGKECMGDMIKSLSGIMKEKIIDNKSEENQICDDDKEFYYSAGQLTRYLLSLSQADKTNYSLIDPILNAKDSNRIKNEILKLIKKYSYALNINSSRINKLISMIMGYELDNPSNVLFDVFMAGFTSQNLIYYKEKEEEKDVKE